MYQLNNAINTEIIEDFKASKLLDINAKEVLLIHLKKDAVFPKHTSPREAILLMLEGKVTFFINNSEVDIEKHQTFNFPKEEEHWVKAKDDSKFLIIR